MKEKVKLKPFHKQDEYTMMHNVVLDHIMPKLSGSAWKVLSVIIRQTIGWHKENDELSFNQIKKKSGIKSDTTVSEAIKQLEKMSLIIVDRPDLDTSNPASFWKSNIYSLNLEFEIEVKDPTPKNGVPPLQKMEYPSPKNGVGTTPENGVGVLQKMETQKKESLNKDSKEIAAATAAVGKLDPETKEVTQQSDPLNDDSAFAAICQAYWEAVGKAPPKVVADEIRAWLKRCPAEWLLKALEKMGKANSSNWGYVESIMKKWEACGGPQNDHKPGRNGVAKNGKSTNEPSNLNPANPNDWQAMLKSVANKPTVDRPPG